LRVLPAEIAQHDEPRVQADADTKAHVVRTFERRVERVEHLDDRERRTDGARRAVFVRGRKAEVHEYAVAAVVGHVAAEARDRCGDRLLPAAVHLGEFFGIEAFGEFGRIDEIAEHHREMATLGLHAARLLRLRRDHRRGHRGHGRRPVRGSIDVDERGAVFFSRDAKHIDEFVAQIADVLVVDLELPAQRTKGNASAFPQNPGRGLNDLVKGHRAER